MAAASESAARRAGVRACGMTAGGTGVAPALASARASKKRPRASIEVQRVPPTLDGLEDDAPAADGSPAVQGRHVDLASSPSRREQVDRVRQGAVILVRRNAHRQVLRHADTIVCVTKGILS